MRISRVLERRTSLPEGQDVKKRRKPWPSSWNKGTKQKSGIDPNIASLQLTSDSPRYEQSISLEVNRLCMEGFDTSFSHTYCVVLLPLVWSLYHILGSTCFPKEMAEKKREVYASAAEKYSPVKVKQ